MRERNFAREQLEARLEEAEGRVEEHRRALASVPRLMKALRDHLVPLLPGGVVLAALDHVGEESRPERCLEDGLRGVLSALRHIVSGERREGELAVPSESGNSVEGEISGCGEEVERLQDENKALQNRCEDMDSALADARFATMQSCWMCW